MMAGFVCFLASCSCYYDVSRLEATLLLEREAERGNLLLRPRKDENSFAVTTRQDLDRYAHTHPHNTRLHNERKVCFFSLHTEQE